MTKIILCGCGGKMGAAITGIVNERDDCQIVAGVDVNTACSREYQVYSNIGDVKETADVIIDFSHPSTLDSILAYAVEKQVPAILCTTGYSEAQNKQIEETSKKVALFHSGNMSLGINLLIALSRKAAQILGGSFDVEIVEKHHNQKIDAPSGTALMIAKAISEELPYESRYEYDRHSVRRKRERAEIGIHSVRGGSIVGEHEVIFAGHDEVVTIAHSAQSKGVFAAGAVNAAVFLKGKPAGLYDMNDLIAEA
ncbi:MAG: 4-hydroxy-tetrahydrodipicolinate reductase [Clostridia bacterium]|nr:4-hydroxy-tetrahydrodipicolinate reductase [Clostridia bacterium]